MASVIASFLTIYFPSAEWNCAYTDNIYSHSRSSGIRGLYMYTKTIGPTKIESLNNYCKTTTKFEVKRFAKWSVNPPDLLTTPLYMLYPAFFPLNHQQFWNIVTKIKTVIPYLCCFFFIPNHALPWQWKSWWM